MGSYAIRMQFDTEASPETVREALTTTDGIASWWSDHVEGEPDTDGGQLQVAFPDLPQPFSFRVELDGERISWETEEFPPWWAGTAIRWSVTAHPEQDGGTLLAFRHEGFEPEADIVAVITPAWTRFIDGLVSYAETGEPATSRVVT